MQDESKNIYSVSQLNSQVKFLLEDTYTSIWVEGEISNFAAPHSGHWYFSLKDPSAQVRCAMFRANQRGLGFVPKDGAHVLIRARVSLYENRGDFQLIADFMEERGEGKLRRAYEELKKKLAAAGLFAEDHKKSLPTFPKHIGVITSATGAAIRDILNVLKRRAPYVPIIIYPTMVQGASAAPTIVKAIQTANQRKECDVLILARGGGSLEDLWPFNEESVAHAIYQSEIPIISGIGHEVDFTIADYVADVRAPTPSAAAEIISHDNVELMEKLSHHQKQFVRCMQNKLASIKQHIAWAKKHLLQLHPKRQLMEKMQRLDYYEMTLARLMKNFIHHKQMTLANVAVKLNALSPLATLQRGFSITTRKNAVLSDVKNVSVGDNVQVRLEKGTIDCTVDKISY